MNRDTSLKHEPLASPTGCGGRLGVVAERNNQAVAWLYRDGSSALFALLFGALGALDEPLRMPSRALT